MINLATKPKVTPKSQSTVIKPKAKTKKPKVMDPKEFKGTYKYDRDARIQVCVDKNPKREGSGGYKRFELYRTGMTIRNFLEKGGKTIDLDWDRERGFVATEDKDKSGHASKTLKATFTLK
jgi:hypothetical protein|tara:strand:+ start:200 stop:562 length:363 start_codon:yes stop_codon:yes gene_type:complete